MPQHLDWREPVRSLFNHLADQGMIPIRVNDGEEIITLTQGITPLDATEEAVDIITAVEVSGVAVQFLDANGNAHETDLKIVLDGPPDEIVYDWFIPDDTNFSDAIDRAIERFSAAWENYYLVPTIKDT